MVGQPRCERESLVQGPREADRERLVGGAGFQADMVTTFFRLGSGAARQARTLFNFVRSRFLKPGLACEVLCLLVATRSECNQDRAGNSVGLRCFGRSGVHPVASLSGYWVVHIRSLAARFFGRSKWSGSGSGLSGCLIRTCDLDDLTIGG